MIIFAVLFIILGVAMIALGAKLSSEEIIRSNAKGREVREQEKYVKGNRIIYILVGIVSIFISILAVFKIIDAQIMLVLYLVFWIVNKLGVIILNNLYVVKNSK